MSQGYDAIVVGAGVMGASSAMHLASAGLRRLLVLEKAPGVGFGSTGKSSACIRQTYSRLETTQMAYEGLQCFKNWQEFTGLEQTRAGFNNCGVLFLLGKDDPSLPVVLENHKRVGVVSTLLDAQARREAFPDLDDCSTQLDLSAEEHECQHDLLAIHELEGGFADPVGTAEDMLEVARRLGTMVRFNARVTEVLQAGGRVTGVAASIDGQRTEFHAPVVINCAGPWASGVNDAAGAPLRQKLVPTRIQVVGKRFPEQLKGNLPMVADMVNGVYFRPEAGGGRLIVGSIREEDEREVVADPDHYNEVADAPFREELLTLLHHRVPTFHARGDVTSYAALYTINPEDSHPIIDASELEGFFYVCGFSGHGFKLSPIVGTLVAQKVLGRWGRVETKVPLDFLDRNRAPFRTMWGGVIA